MLKIHINRWETSGEWGAPLLNGRVMMVLQRLPPPETGRQRLTERLGYPYSLLNGEQGAKSFTT